jgi:hypothetical protein
MYGLSLTEQEDTCAQVDLVSEPEVPRIPTPATEDSGIITFDPSAFEKLLQRECKHWQRKLRLQDWNVKVSLLRLNEMPDQECIGAILPMIERKDANMMLLSPMDVPLLSSHYLNDEEVNYGLTIVHELLHLHLAAFTQTLTPDQTVAEEQAINALSRAFIDAYSSQVKKVSPTALTPAASVGLYL